VDRIRVAVLQYFIRPVPDFEAFEAQVRGLVETAADYRCQLIVFPEYFTLQLLTLGDVTLPVPDQVRSLADQVPRFLEVFRSLAQRLRVYIVAGTIPVWNDTHDRVVNTCYVFGPDGTYGSQGKLSMTRFESEEWMVDPSLGLTIFDTTFGKLAVAICYDVEFPEIVRVAALQGVKILAVPSCTDDRQGFLRVRYCAHARAIENQMYVLHAGTVGSLPMVPAVSMNYGQAAILTPSDFSFARDGILAEGNANQEMMVIGELNLSSIEEQRQSGTVLPLRDSLHVGKRAVPVTVVAI
jgi:predicted amidohydrolase